ADAGTINGTYGVLTLDAETGAYSYRLYTEGENQAAYDAVQALDESDAPLTDTFLYNATDGTAESNETSLTISIFGANDAPVVTADAVAVSDEGLANGNPDNVGNADTTNLATASGQIGIADVDDSSFTVTFDAIPTESLAVADGTANGAAITWALSNGDKTLTGTI
ncbi:VCBS domain-containing protein, partial [Segeticoccus rhizosphaerae]|uniref:VCBS domain-containing protein n=1 Tax=Segeticoccus rhizosphaerae TaxID=1104777 RepID=UPI00193A6ABD